MAKKSEKRDAATEKVLTDGERIARLVDSDAWREVKSRLMQKIMDLQSIMNIMGNSHEEAVIDLKSRRMAVETLVDLIRDIEGDAVMHKSNADILQENTREFIVQRFD